MNNELLHEDLMKGLDPFSNHLLRAGVEGNIFPVRGSIYLTV